MSPLLNDEYYESTRLQNREKILNWVEWQRMSALWATGRQTGNELQSAVHRLHGTVTLWRHASHWQRDKSPVDELGTLRLQGKSDGSPLPLGLPACLQCAAAPAARPRGNSTVKGPYMPYKPNELNAIVCQNFTRRKKIWRCFRWGEEKQVSGGNIGQVNSQQQCNLCDEVTHMQTSFWLVPQFHNSLFYLPTFWHRSK